MVSYVAEHGDAIAEEVQLLAEEKWLVEALNKIKKQRNSLQIERLHLESLKAKLLQGSDPKPSETLSISPASASTAIQTMQSAVYNRSEYELALDPLEQDLLSCNHENLDLTVSSYCKSQESKDARYNMEEFDEADEDDDEDDEGTYKNLLIDINMLMNGKHSDG